MFIRMCEKYALVRLPSFRQSKLNLMQSLPGIEDGIQQEIADILSGLHIYTSDESILYYLQINICLYIDASHHLYFFVPSCYGLI